MLLSFILGGGLSSRLVQRVRTELGFTYGISSYELLLVDTGALLIGSGLKKDTFYQGLVEIVNVIKLMKKDGITKEELALAKESTKGGYAIDLEDHHTLNGFLSSRKLLYGKPISYEEFARNIDNVKVNDVEELIAEIFTLDRFSLAVVGEVDEAKVKALIAL